MDSDSETVPLIPHVNTLLFADSKWDSLEFRKRCFWKLAFFAPIAFIPFTMVTPASVELQYQLVCRYMGLSGSDDQCSSNSDVNAYIAHYNSISTLVSTIPTLLMIPVVMAFVEKIGLVYGIMFTMSGLAAQLIGWVPITYWVPAHWSPYRMLVFEFTSALTGTSCMQNLLLLAAAQLFPEAELRPKFVGQMLAAVALGGLAGPSIGAFTIDKLGVSNCFLIATISWVVSALLFLLFVELPPLVANNTNEEVVAAAKKGWSEVLTEQLYSLKVFTFSHLPSWPVRITAIFLTMWIGLFREMDSGDLNLVILYSKQFLGWHQGGVSTIITISSSVSLFWNLVGFPVLQRQLLKFYKAKPDSIDSIDKFFILLGVAFQTLGLLMLSVFKTSKMFTFGFLVFTCIQASSCIVKPALLKLVPTEEATSLMTALTVLDTICGALIPTIMMYIYEHTLRWWPTLLFEWQFTVSFAYLIAAYFLIRI